MKIMDVLNHCLPRGYVMHAGRTIVLSLQKFLRNRTDTAEMKYKAYKNKLTSILRSCEKIIILIYSNKKKTTLRGYGRY